MMREPTFWLLLWLLENKQGSQMGGYPTHPHTKRDHPTLSQTEILSLSLSIILIYILHSVPKITRKWIVACHDMSFWFSFSSI